MATYKIALLGDAVLEKWGENCPSFERELKRLYAHTTFQIENHGLAGSRAGHGLWRIAHHYPRGGQMRLCLSASSPDIVILESFAYTNYLDGPEGLGEYRDVLRRVAEEIGQTTVGKLVFLLAPPPHRDRFAENQVNYHLTSKATRQRMADGIKLYLDEARHIALDEGWHVADACAEVERLVAGGQNHRRFVDQDDGVTLSEYGYEAVARVLVRAVDDHRLIEEVLHR